MVVVKSAQKSLSHFIPQPALEYCLRLHRQYRFKLIITPPRRTRLGCFSVRPMQQPVIRINGNLNPYSFVITYLHEVAHCAVYLENKRKTLPHGKEWKQAFRRLLMPVMNASVFPEEILGCLLPYAADPKAATGSDRRLSAALGKYDVQTVEEANKIPLMHVREGEIFVFQTRLFIRGALRRTRVLCTEKKSSRRFTIPAHVLVEQPEPM